MLYLSVLRVLRSVPVLFYKPTSALIGPGAPIIIPTFAQPTKEHLPDYETELVIVIGRPAKNVSEADALDYVLGYTGLTHSLFFSPRRHPFLTVHYVSCQRRFFPQTPVCCQPVEFLKGFR
jgi:hypothetical protein